MLPDDTVRAVHVTEPKLRVVESERGLSHLVHDDAAGPPWLALCGASIVGRLLPDETTATMTPCPRCSRVRLDLRRCRSA